MIFNPAPAVSDRKIRVFSLSQSFLDDYRGKQPDWGYNGLGYFTYKRTYARKLCECVLDCDHPTEEFWQTVQRVVEGCFNIQKIHCRKNGLPWNEPKAQRSAQEMYRRIWQFKFSPPGRGFWMMGTDLIYEKGSAALQNCFAGDTEVITAHGVRTIRDLAEMEGDPTLLTSGGKWVQAPVRSFGTQRLYKLTLTRQGVDKVIYCTGDHRWFARDRRQAHRNKGYTEFKTTELRPEVHHLQYVFGQGIKGLVKPSVFGVAHGFTFGDGRTSHGERNANTVSLFGEGDAALKPYFSGSPARDIEGGVEFGALPNFFRERPSITENKSYLLGWLMGYFAADGAVSNGQVVISSANEDDLKFYRDVCVVLGIGTYEIRPDTRESNLTGREHTQYRMTLMRDTLTEDFFILPAHRQSFLEAGGEEVLKRHWTVKSVEETDRVEEVYCATVEGYGAFALEGNILTGNCAFVSTKDIDEDFASPFTFLMDMSMLGVGVGADCRGQGKVKIQVPRYTTEPFVVEDSREGWVELLRVVLNSFVGKGSFPLVVDYSKVRKRGEPIKGFGGVASGPGPLKKLVEGVTKILMPKGVTFSFSDLQSSDGEDRVYVTILETQDEVAAPYRITSSQIVDVFNYIGKCVVAGNVRRSAEIMFSEFTDQEFISLKDPTTLNTLYAQLAEAEARLEKDKARGLPTEAHLAEIQALEKEIEAHPLIDRRWASNNSVFGYVGMDYSAIAKAIAGNGEPGICWIENARQYSRMGHLPDNKDWRVMGTNPCGEQSLESFELCNLVETYPANHDSLEDFKATLKMAYLYAKTVTLVPTHDPRANQVMTRNRRIGCSMSGIVQAVAKLGRRQFFNWCEDGYDHIQKLDRTYSEWLGVPLSIKTTSIKPSGTVSLLSGATPGIHYPESEFYIRRVRISNTSPLVAQVRAAGYHVEKDEYSDDTSVISFPVREANFSKGKKEVSIWEQFALAAAIQRHWADNQVSVTVTFKQSEVGEIQACLETFENQLKSVSMLPLSDHGYVQAPYEPIDEETYIRMVSDLKPLILDGGTHDRSAEEKFCANDVCEIRLPKA